jgi:hypothetical protein
MSASPVSFHHFSQVALSGEGKFATFRIYGVEGIDAPAPQPSK